MGYKIEKTRKKNPKILIFDSQLWLNTLWNDQRVSSLDVSQYFVVAHALEGKTAKRYDLV